MNEWMATLYLASVSFKKKQMYCFQVGILAWKLTHFSVQVKTKTIVFLPSIDHLLRNDRRHCVTDYNWNSQQAGSLCHPPTQKRDLESGGEISKSLGSVLEAECWVKSFHSCWWHLHTWLYSGGLDAGKLFRSAEAKTRSWSMEEEAVDSS